MASDRTCTAQFTLCGGNPVEGPLSSLYASITDAYNSLVPLTTTNLKITASNRLEDLGFDRNIVLGLFGGYACDFVSRPGLAYITGTITISKGSVFLDRIVIL